jgi:PAS domain S-box-containing protein
MEKTAAIDNQHIYIIEGNTIFTIVSFLKKQLEFEKNLSTVLYFNPVAPRVLYEKDIKDLQKTHVGFRYYEFSSLFTHDAALDYINTTAHFYISGGVRHINAVKDVLDLLKIPEKQIHITAGAIDISDYEVKSKINPHLLAGEVLNQTSNHIVFTDENGFLVYANPAAERLTGYTFPEMRNHTPRLWGGLMPRDFYKKMWHTISVERKDFIGKINNRRKNGTQYTAYAHISPIIDSAGNLMGFMGTEEDITELENIDRSKTEFISIASHQLRTPISIVKWYSELFLDGDLGTLTPDQQSAIEKINKSNERMVELVNSLLNISRLEMGTFFVELQDTNIIAIAEKAVEENSILAQNKQINIFPVLDRSIPILTSDPKLLDIIFQNLISNSIKYTPNSGHITVSVTQKESSIIIEVADTGLGIPDYQQDKIFMKLFRADNVKKADTQGTGLGLYVVKSITERLGGTISFVSKENEGTTFTVVIPLTPTKI